MPCRMDHIVKNVKDDATMIAFFVDLLGRAAELRGKYRDGRVLFPANANNEMP